MPLPLKYVCARAFFIFSFRVPRKDEMMANTDFLRHYAMVGRR